MAVMVIAIVVIVVVQLVVILCQLRVHTRAVCRLNVLVAAITCFVHEI